MDIAIDAAKALLQQEVSWFNSSRSVTLMLEEAQRNLDLYTENAIIVWTRAKIALLVAIVLACLIGLTLNAVIILGTVFSKEPVTGADVLVLNNCVINVLMISLSIAPHLVVQFVLDEHWPFSLGFCHTWNYFRGLLIMATGCTLIVLSVHQLTHLASVILPKWPNSAWYSRCPKRLKVSSPVACIWIVAIVTQITFFELAPSIEFSSCGFEMADYETPHYHTLVLVEDLGIFWLPTTISMLTVIFFGVIVLRFKEQARPLFVARLPEQRVRYNARSTASSDRTRLMDVDPEDADSFETHEGLSFAPSEAHPYTVTSEVTTKPSDRNNPAEYTAQEFSRESASAWAALVLIHFFLIAPSYLAILISYQLMNNIGPVMVVHAVTMVILAIKFVLADAVALLTVTPRYRRRLTTLRCFRR